nr:molybdopterin oxidoreductase family protein [uncultured Rhodopila sp.]
MDDAGISAAAPIPPVLTHCPYCALQCGMTLVSHAGGLQVAARDFPTNKGGLCRKGWTAASLLDAPDRLTSPLARASRDAPLLPVSWDYALDRIAGAMRNIQAAHGMNAFGIFGGGGLTNEKAYALGKFARVALRTANIDYNGRFCMAAAAAASVRSFGIDRGLPFPLEDIPRAGTILLAGANPAETMPPVMQYFDAQRAAGGILIVSDPRRTATAKAADLHLQLTPGTDAALANGLLHIAIQRGLIDRAYIQARTSGFEAVRRIVASYWPDRVERITGVPERLLVRAAVALGDASSAMVLTARGAEQQSHGVDNVAAFINLTLALGLPGRRNSGFGTLTGQGNGQGGREHGQKADQLPGYRKLDNPAHRAEVAAVWGVDPDSLPAPGLSANELLKALGGPVRGLMVMASNILVSAPDAGALNDRIGALDFLAVADVFLSETAARADVVLPVTQWAEEDGTMTNLEGCVLLRRRAAVPPEGVRNELQILQGLAERLGAGGHFSADAGETFAELRRASAGGVADYAGISYARIAAEDGVFWPCPSADHPGTKRLFETDFPTADRRARFHPVEHRGTAEPPDRDYPHFLTTGRLMGHYQSGTQTRRVPELAAAQPEPFAEMHPQTARDIGVGEGRMVRLTTRRGQMTLKARLTPDIRMDTVFVPFHWGGAGAANLLTNTALDAVARIPEFKVCAVRVEPADQPRETA